MKSASVSRPQLEREVVRETLTRKCQLCGSERLLILFPKTPKLGAYSKVCQVCTTEQSSKDEALLRSVCFRRHKRVVPLREKLKCTP